MESKYLLGIALIFGIAILWKSVVAFCVMSHYAKMHKVTKDEPLPTGFWRNVILLALGLSLAQFILNPVYDSVTFTKFFVNSVLTNLIALPLGGALGWARRNPEEQRET